MCVCIVWGLVMYVCVYCAGIGDVCMYVCVYCTCVGIGDVCMCVLRGLVMYVCVCVLCGDW